MLRLTARQNVRTEATVGKGSGRTTKCRERRQRKAKSVHSLNDSIGLKKVGVRRTDIPNEQHSLPDEHDSCKARPLGIAWQLLAFFSPLAPQEKMAENNLKRTESYQYPSGHIGHLSSNQQSSLDQFKQLCQEKGYYKPAGVGGRTVPSHDDETLLYA